jgi:hypothetical protein
MQPDGETRHSDHIPREECCRLLVATGFHERVWHDVTAQTVVQAQTCPAGAEAAAVRAIIAPTHLEERVANRLRNYAEGHVVQWCIREPSIRI